MFRYYIGNNYTIAATSAPLSVGVSRFSVNVPPGTVAAGASLTVTWTAPAGRPAGDSVQLFRIGVSNINPTAVQYVNGSAGTFTMQAPQTAGQYRFRYLLGGNGWITAALGPAITVQ